MDQDQTNECETPDSGIFSPDSGILSPDNSSRRTSTSSHELPINSHRSTPMDSGISSPMVKNDVFSQPVDAQKLESALNLQLTVSGPSGPPRSFNIEDNKNVDELISHSAQLCGLGSSSDVYLINGTETLQRGSKMTVKQAKIANNSHLQLMTRCVGG